MTTGPSRTRRNTALSVLVVVLAATEALFVMLGQQVWHQHQRAHLTTTDAATFALLGASAALGVVLYLIAAFALARPSHTAAQVTAAGTWLRLGAVLLILATIAIRLGSTALAGALQTAGAALAVIDAVIALSVMNVTLRRTRTPAQPPQRTPGTTTPGNGAAC